MTAVLGPTRVEIVRQIEAYWDRVHKAKTVEQSENAAKLTDRWLELLWDQMTPTERIAAEVRDTEPVAYG